MTAWAMGLVAGLPWEVVGILYGYLPHLVPQAVSHCVGETPREAEAASLCPAQGFPMTALGRCSMGMGGRTVLNSGQACRGAWPLGAQVQAEGTAWVAVSGLQRHPDQLLTHWLR